MHRNTCRSGLLLVVITVSLAFSACSSEPAATATPTKTPGAAGESATSEPTSAVATAAPTFTAEPAPAATTVVEPTSTLTSPPEPHAMEGLIGPEDYPPDVNPLTGRTMADPSVLDRRPIAVKISNYPPQYVRPQSGLDKADLVFEHYAEGGVTRLTAVFYGQGADRVGSVRSGRLIDLEIPAMYQAAFAYSGSSIGVRDKMRKSDFFDRVISPDFGYGEPYFVRVPREGIPFEHTLFADLYDIWAWLEDNDDNARPELKGLVFGEAVPEGDTGAAAENILVGYIAGDCQVKWVYNAGTGRYLRWQGGEAHTDLLSGAQLSAANVVILGAHHEDTDILEDNVAGGHYSIEIQVWNEGPATLFRDGLRYEGRWHRVDRDDMVTFTDLEGNPLPFKPGNTWFQVVPLGFDRLTVE
jgi:hypothetical protein